MIPSRVVAASLACAALAAGAHADIFMEIEPHNRPPDGLVAGDLFGTMTFDVYIWGTNGDTSVRNLSFTLGVPDGAADFTINALGAADPTGLFATRHNGQLGPWYIDLVRMNSPTTPTVIGSSPETATLIYSDFVATLNAAGGRMEILIANIGVVGNLSPIIYSIGVHEVPAPSCAAVLGVGALVLGRRRR